MRGGLASTHHPQAIIRVPSCEVVRVRFGDNARLDWLLRLPFTFRHGRQVVRMVEDNADDRTASYDQRGEGDAGEVSRFRHDTGS
jgi:hypothetical protein